MVCTTLLYQACCCCCICCIGGMSAGFGYLIENSYVLVFGNELDCRYQVERKQSNLPRQIFEMNTSFLAPARLAPFFLLTKTVESATLPRSCTAGRSVAVRISAFAENEQKLRLEAFQVNCMSNINTTATTIPTSTACSNSI